MVVYLPEKMNSDAANRLLKAIEEPEGKTQLLFITHSPDKVLPTISSRCLRIRLVPDNNVKGNEYLGPNMDLFRSLMDALLSKDLGAALEVGEELAALKSREKMKSFCRMAGTAFRDMFMIQQGLPQLSTGGGGEYLQELAAKCKKTFPRQAQAVIDRAHMLIDRNVNQKILFCDMVDRLFLMI